MTSAIAAGLALTIALAAGAALGVVQYFDDIVDIIAGNDEPPPFLPEDVQ